jgi:UrcA family protein
MNIRLIAVSAALTATFVSNAWALDVRAPTEVHVSTIGVDFSRPASVTQFYSRLRIAARTACNSRMGRDLAATLADQRCAVQALDRAVAETGKPTLMALHTRRTGHTPPTMLASN